MKKLVLFALLGSFALSLLAGCSGGAADKEALDAKDQAKTEAGKPNEPVAATE